MMQTIFGRLVLAVLTLTACNTLLAQDDDDLIVAPDEFVYCTVCHGVQLMGNVNINAPRLSGMEVWYVEQQLNAFRKGWRGTHDGDLIGMEMRPMATVLTDEQVVEVSEFVNRTSSPPPSPTVSGDAAAGRNHYTTCAACHGVNAEGNEALGAPALTGLNDWYLVRQLQNYLSGVRGSDPADSYGMQMRASTQLLGNDEAILDVVSYITTLPTN